MLSKLLRDYLLMKYVKICNEVQMKRQKKKKQDGKMRKKARVDFWVIFKKIDAELIKTWMKMKEWKKGLCVGVPKSNKR